MKKILKFFNAALFLAAFGVSYVELVRLAVVNASLIDLIKLGFGKASGSSFAREIIDMVQEEVKPLAVLAVILIVLMWLGVILSVLLRKNLPYICSLILALIQAAGVTAIYFTVDSKLEVFREGLDFFGLGNRIKMYSYTLIMWLVIYGVIILFSIIGLVLKGKQKAENHGPIMTEQFNPRRNPLENQKPGKYAKAEQDYLAKIQELERKNGEDRAQRAAASGRVQQNVTAPQQSFPKEIPPQAEPKPVLRKAEEAERVQQKTAQPENAGKTFTGAVVGVTGMYASKAYALKEKQRVFFVAGEGTVSLLEIAQEPSVAAVYYIEEYKEYCVEVHEAKSFFLKSGQPLGKGRTYYLPRGTEIYIITKENLFKLA